MKNEYQLRLVQRIQAGDAAAEPELFRQYKDPIFWKICRSIKTDPENIKDIASEVYLAIIEGLRKVGFQPDRWESLDAYIWGVTNHKICDWFKKKKVGVKILDPEPPSKEIADASEEYLLENAELAQILRSSLATLDAKYKEVLELRYFKELSVQEISAQLGIDPRRVSERIHYALKKLRKAFEKKNKASSILSLLLLLLL